MRELHSNPIIGQNGNQTNGHELRTEWPFFNPPLFSFHHLIGYLNQVMEAETNFNSIRRRKGNEANGCELKIGWLASNSSQFSSQQSNGSSIQGVVEEGDSNSIRRMDLPLTPSCSR